MKTKFTQLVDNTHNILNEQEPPAEPAPGDSAAVGGAPPVPPPVPEAPEPAPGPQAIEDLTIASKIALQIDGLSPEDRSMLIEPVDGSNIANIRDLLGTIAAKYDVPD